MSELSLLTGDCRELLPTLPERSVQCVITSPPYWKLRDYGVRGQLGQEEALEEYVENLVGVFRQVRRALREDAVVFVVLGDCYVDKQLQGAPWKVAFALQEDGWILRSDCIWSKPNPMPESVTDRPTRSHEYVFLLSKSATYYWDAQAVAEPSVSDHPSGNGYKRDARMTYRNPDGTARGNDAQWQIAPTRNLRSVWTIATAPYTGAHFATFPPALVERCLLAGTSPQACEVCGAPWARVVEQSITGSQHRSPKDKTADDARGARGFDSSRLHTQYFDYQTTTTGWQPTCHCPDNTGSARCTILDPFAGSGTVAKVAIEHNRNAVLIDLSSDYASLQLARTNGVQRRLWLDE